MAMHQCMAACMLIRLVIHTPEVRTRIIVYDESRRVQPAFMILFLIMISELRFWRVRIHHPVPHSYNANTAAYRHKKVF